MVNPFKVYFHLCNYDRAATVLHMFTHKVKGYIKTSIYIFARAYEIG